MGKRIRLDKLLADCGKGTRSEVKAHIKKGLVFVNGSKANSGDIKIDTDLDEVIFDGISIEYEEYVYYMLNKPAGVVSATEDKTDKTVIDLIRGEKPRNLFPVGRLDKDTEGLLILTNDGKLANNLLSPKKHVEKKYYAKVSGVVTERDITLFEQGVDIGDETKTRPAGLEIIDTSSETNCSEVHITITEGRYHQIKRMFEAVDKKVMYLKRLSMGRLSLDEKLLPGEYRRLSEEEVDLLKDR